MKAQDVLQVYDYAYAAEYDRTYIENPEMLPSTLYQAALLKQLMSGARAWLDLACGTGFYLALFEHVPRRCGLDMSAQMLSVARARERNRDVELVEGSFLTPRADWTQRWDRITCMWWAYCLVESIHDIEQLVARIAEWLTPDGVAFIPLCNPRRFREPAIELPASDPEREGVTMTGILWSWTEPSGKVHPHMVSPFPETMVALFRERFRDVEIESAPLSVVPAGYWSGDYLIARNKR
jgi:SAM-dependent methyltransferase